MAYDFSNKIALITGSGRGIGRTTALHLARLGADIVVNYLRKKTAAEETTREIEAMGRHVLMVRADIGEPEDIDTLFSQVESTFGRLDILVNNAASGYARPIMDQKVKGWDWTMNINARAALFTSQKAVPLMQKSGGGAIVNVSSIGAVRTLPDYAVIGASKSALEAITRYCAVEFSKYNIVVNAVSPGIIDTDALNYFNLSRDVMVQGAKDRTPAGRIVTPQDVANCIAFLCSPEACMIRGQVILIDGGYMIAVT